MLPGVCVEMVNRKVVFDIDGVILDFVSAFCEVCRANGYDLTYRAITQYHMGRVLGIHGEEFKRLLSLTHNSGLIEPYSGAVAGLADVRAEGSVITLVTGRPESVRETTVETLLHAGVAYDQLAFSRPGRKVEHSKGAAVVVEDSLEEGRILAANGLPVLLMRHPWNVSGEGGTAGISWVEDWAELVPTILNEYLL